MSTIKISLVFLLVLGIMAGIFYWYFEYSQGKIQVLLENNSKLTAAVQTQNETIKAQEAFSLKQNQDITALQEGLQSANNDKNVLIQKLLKIDLNAHARKNSTATEKKINSATAKAFKDLEAITGATSAKPAPITK